MICDNRRWMQHCTSFMVYIVQTKSSYSAECRCISGVPLTAAVCRSPQTEASQSKSKQIIGNRRKSKQFASAVCRSHQRCAADISGGPLKLWLRPLDLQASKEAIGLKRNQNDKASKETTMMISHQRCAIQRCAAVELMSGWPLQ